MASNLKCADCLFWQPLHPDADGGYAADRNYSVSEDSDGICRRLPPIGQRRDMPPRVPPASDDAVDAALWAQWPVTSGDLDWCGEFQLRTPVVPI